MSHERLPRQGGIAIRCNHGQISVGSRKVTNRRGEEVTEYLYGAACSAVHFTGNIRIDVNREDAARNGWRRDSLPTPRRRMLDICPIHAPVAKQIIEERAAKKLAKQQARDEKARARLAKKAA